VSNIVLFTPVNFIPDRPATA